MYHLRVLLFSLFPIFVGIGFIINQFAISTSFSNTEKSDSNLCNCVIFRLDGVQDYYTQYAQMTIMNLFLNKSQSLTLGLIANNIGNDTMVVDKILEGYKNGLFELSVHGWNFTDYSKLSEKEQESALLRANEKIGILFGQTPNVFIPPYGSYNNHTLTAMGNVGLEVLSTFSDLDKDEYNIKKRINNNNGLKNIIYHIPATTSFSDYDNNGNKIKVPIQQILNRTLTNLATHGYAVVSLEPEYFTNTVGSPDGILKKNEINDLSVLMDSLLSKGIPIENFSKLAKIKTTTVENKTATLIERSNTNQTFNANASMLENDTITIINRKQHADTDGPTLKDPTLRVEQIVHLDNITTGMAFLSEDDILVLEKNNGTVQRVVNGKILPEPILDVSVANKDERGMLGIAIAKHDENKKKINSDTYNRTYVYLFFTESGQGEDGTDSTPNNEPLGSRLYRYEFTNNKLINPRILLDLPAITARENIEKVDYGGKILLGPDGNIYVGIGEVGKHRTLTENNITGGRADGTGGILRIKYDGRSVQNSLLASEIDFLKYYYAYGIRNTFGMDFDPITGILWDTENGPKFGDEINMVLPAFNSGWIQIQGIWNVNSKSEKTGIAPDNPKGLVDFDQNGIYSKPEFVWDKPVGVTALKFLNSSNLGKKYENSVFVGDTNLGYLYNFKLSPDRMSLSFDNSGLLYDKVAGTPAEMQNGEIIFGKGFGTITEIEEGPDGNLYILNLFGDIFRISSASVR